MKTYVLVALGCIFWLVPLAFLVMLTVLHGTLENWFGFHYEASGFGYALLLLFAIPLVMLALTPLLGWLARRGRLSDTMLVGFTASAVVAACTWLATLFLVQTA